MGRRAVKPPSLPAWDAVIVNFNTGDDLPACIAALRGAQPAPAAIIVVENGSTDHSLAILATQEEIRIVANTENLGFAGGANSGLCAATAPFVAVFNPDVQIAPEWPAALLGACERDATIGAAGGKLLYPDGVTIQTAGSRLHEPRLLVSSIGGGERDTGQYDTERDVDAYPSAALLLRRSALAAVGIFDERFFPAYYADADLCYRLRQQGWAVRYVPAAIATHREGITRDPTSPRHKVLYHLQRTQFAMKHLSRQQLLERFLPAEVAAVAEADGSIRMLENENAEGRAYFAALETALAASRDRVGRLETDATDRTDHLAALEADMVAKQAAILRLEAEQAAKQAYIIRLEAERAALHAHAREVERDATDLQAYARKLERDITDLHTYPAQLEARSAALLEYAERLETALGETHAYPARLEAHIAEITAYARRLEASLAEIAPYAQRLAAALGEVVPYTHTLEAAVAAMQPYVQALEAAHAEAHAYIAQLETSRGDRDTTEGEYGRNDGIGESGGSRQQPASLSV